VPRVASSWSLQDVLGLGGEGYGQDNFQIIMFGSESSVISNQSCAGQVFNRCIGRISSSSGTSSWPNNPSQRGDLATLDPSELERQHADRILIEPFPTLRDLDLDPRQSFELQRTKYPGVTSFTEEHALKKHDWLRK